MKYEVIEMQSNYKIVEENTMTLKGNYENINSHDFNDI